MDARVEDFSSRIVVIRSDRCTSASSECEASFVLPKPIVPAHGSVAMIQLLKLSFPHSYYLINEYTDKLIVSGVTYDLEHGNYNPSTMLVYLRSILPISVDYVVKQYKFIFSHTSAFTLDSGSTCLTILGYKTTQCDTAATTLKGEMCADLHGHHSLKIKSNFALDSLDSTSGNDSHLLARIPVEGDTHEGSSFVYEHFRPAHKMRYLIRDQAISEVSIRIVDHDDHHVSFNGIPWSIKLVISIVQREKILPMHQSDDAASIRTPDDDAQSEAGSQDGEQAPSATGQPRAVRAPRRGRKRKQTTRRIRPRKK